MMTVVGNRRRWSRVLQCGHRGQCGHNQQERCEPYDSSLNLVHGRLLFLRSVKTREQIFSQIMQVAKVIFVVAREGAHFSLTVYT